MSLKKLKPKKVLGLFVILMMAGLSFVFLPIHGIVHGQNAEGRRFVRLDYAPSASSDSSNDQKNGKLLISFDGSVKAELRPEAGIPLVYVDILGAKLDVNPLETPFANGPVRVARLAQLSTEPPVVRASLFLREILHPNITSKNGEIEIAFENKQNNQTSDGGTGTVAGKSGPTPFSLVAPEPVATISANVNLSKNVVYTPIRLEVKNSDLIPLIVELNKQTGMNLHFRDSFENERIDLSLTAGSPVEAMSAAVEKASGTLTIEDEEIWISRNDNPLLLFSDQDTVEGADLRGLAVGDVLRAIGQIGKFNIILDQSLNAKKTLVLDTLLHRMTIRRMFEVLMQLNGITARIIDKHSLLLMSQEAAREAQGSIVRVVNVTSNNAQIKELLANSVKKDVFSRVKIQEDFGNLVLSGDKEAVENVEQTILFIEGRLISAKEKIKRVYFRPNNTLAAALLGLVTSSWGTSGNLPKMLVDPRTESIIITGSPTDVDKALKTCEELDKQPTSQALVKIRIIESGRTHVQEMGLEVLRNTVEVSDLNTLPTKVAVPSVLHALDTDSKVRTLANPMVRCMNKEATNINLTETIPIKALQTTYIQNPNGTQIPQVSENWTTTNTGITLTLTPDIFANKEVALLVNISYSDVLQMVEGHPWTTNRTLQSKIRVKNNETVVIGGLIKKSKSSNRKPFPLINRIPLLKKLIKPLEYETRNEDETEMVILITPTVIDGLSEKNISEKNLAEKSLEVKTPSEKNSPETAMAKK
ncbi:MAG: hypothetical protein HQM08_02735 [Candidatus Riflebacteria bacterium]|nr:hypothetical protein [Candidatus Riflebacteria bacterium]